MAFNIDTVTWKTFTAPSLSQNVAFGYKVIQKDISSLIVSDPLIQISQDKRGLIYSCAVTQGTCSPLKIDVPSEAVNMSLGLSMVQDPQSSKLAICGPTIPRKCVSVTTFNGMCFISENSVFKPPIPSSLRDCPGQIDIAFLLDGSGSVGDYSFRTMKTFVTNMIKRFTDRDGQFAIAVYSNGCVIHYNFNQLKDSTWESKVTNIPYYRGGTYTAAAIKKLVRELFTPNGGARPSAKKILLVITDGVSHDRDLLKGAASQAEAKNIIRFAIGVGKAFNDFSAKQELNTIATDPDNDHVFKVTDFNALNNILQKLEENIITIEGTQTSGDSSRMEFAQDGFSAAFTSSGSMLMSAVGAFQWKGGYKEYLPDYSFQTGTEHESYLGYSMAIATISRTSFAILGAPRYKHKGQPQIGSYFGAEVCVVDLNNDSNTDLLLVSASTYTESDREGKVFVYIFTPQSNFNYLDTLVGMAGQRGRFGSSLASPADLDGDGFMDVLIGAPLEEDGQGSIYIFNGRDGAINSKHSQRIVGSSVRSGLQFFGISLSQSSLDQSQDNLPDIAVGSKGAVLLLRSRPIMRLETKVTYNPTKIPTSDQTDCTKPLQNNLTVCFTMSAYQHRITDLTANINYTITLDAKRPKYRAYFLLKKRLLSDVTNIGLQEVCKSHAFFIEACSEDALNPLSNQLNFTFEGLPSARMQNLTPILLPEIKTSTDYNLHFEINCGTDNLCVDDLRMNFNFSGASNIEVGIMQEIYVTVFVENRGENSYNTLFTLKYPFGLSYRRFTSKQGRVECVSLDAERGVTLGETACQISKPILKRNTQVLFDITYSINKESTLGKNVTFAAEVTSGNDKHSINSEFKKQKTINVKYAIYIALISCDVNLIKNERKLYYISGNMSSGWIEQTGLRAAVFELISSVSLDYDKSKYIFFSSDSQGTAPSLQINTQVEVYEEPNLTKEIIGGVIGGLLLLALITAALYKAGFFKSQYKQMLQEAQGDEGGETTSKTWIHSPVNKACMWISISIAPSFSQSVMAFNIDPVTWKTFTAPSPGQNFAFGYKVIQKDESSLLVSDPLIQLNQTQRGQIYHCAVTEGNCKPLPIPVTNEAVNMSLGLSMSIDPQSSRAVACGPTIPKNCDAITTYNGMCFKINPDNTVSRPVPETLREGPTSQTDIAFLLDGSGSVSSVDFDKMKAFVIEMIKSFIDRDTQFAIAQFSIQCVIHNKFQRVKDAMWWQNEVNWISQQKGRTYTAAAIRKLVGNAFNSDRARRELATIASLPSNNYAFQVTDFDALKSIREKLKENIIAIEGTQTSGDSSQMEFAQDGFSAALTSNAFSEDALNPVSNQLMFTFDGLPSTSMQNIKPILLPEIKTTTEHSLDFEINCEHDGVCVDDLRMDFNFSGASNIEVGIMQEINVTVFVENRGENSYNTHFTLKYPFGLSYRRITSKQGRVECESLDSEQKGSFGETACHISKPILKGNAQAVFLITYSIDKESTFDQSVTFTAQINSGNEQHSQTSQLFRKKSIGVKYAISIALIRHEDSSLHINFTAQKNDLAKPIKQILKVENDFRELTFKVFIRVPVILGDKLIWTDKNIEIPDCVKQRDEQPIVTNFVEVIKKDGVVTGLRAAVFELVSSASLDYDKSKYIFFSSDSQHTAPSLQINTQVEVYEEPNLTKEIIGGVIGGLLLLALITAALYKDGFFKSQYKQMLQEAQGDAGGEPDMT
ncbi:integrin alpha-M-like [Chanodichthys erythropterus]|uniref:integrin alpha-M-like n=1 Tax=Chanodichthys erythropterus TaxID=933992 RepID=UPI00351F661D